MYPRCGWAVRDCTRGAIALIVVAGVVGCAGTAHKLAGQQRVPKPVCAGQSVVVKDTIIVTGVGGRRAMLERKKRVCVAEEKAPGS